MPTSTNPATLVSVVHPAATVANWEAIAAGLDQILLNEAPTIYGLSPTPGTLKILTWGALGLTTLTAILGVFAAIQTPAPPVTA